MIRPYLRGLALALGLAITSSAVAADSLDWNRSENRVDAEIKSWPLARVLRDIASATGWQVYVEPHTEHTVTARFDDLKPADALRRLLGDLNFALLPQTAGPPKLFVYRHSVEGATELVRASKDRKPKPIGNELLVTLKPGARGGIDGLGKRLGAEVVGRLDGAGGYRLRFKDEAAARKARATLEEEDDTTSIETNLELAPPAVLEPLAMSSPEALPLKPDISPSTDKVVVGLIDTVVQGQASGLRDFLQPGLALLGEYAPPGDQITHGTAMAETILDGIARALEDRGDRSRSVPVSILPVDVYGSAETTNTFDVARGVYEALERHANIINLSLGGETESPFLQNLIRMAAERGVLVFASAGNTPGTAPSYPAADPAVIAVTAADGDGNVAPWANRGTFVDALGPAGNVVHLGDRAWLGMGTSFSTSWVSGWAAGSMASARVSPAALRDRTLLRWAPGNPNAATRPN
jgi:hypothetical protein